MPLILKNNDLNIIRTITHKVQQLLLHFTSSFLYISLLFPCIFSPFSGCSPLYGPAITQPPYTQSEIKSIIKDIIEQGERVKSFYSIGSLLAKDRRWEMEANTLIAGNKEPFRIKIELTHTWGKPIVHILIDNQRIEIFSYQENRLYSGKYTADSLSKFLPMPIDPELVWATLRGYPPIVDHYSMISPARGRISLLDINRKELETIQIHPESGLPESIAFPLMDVHMAFSEFYEYKGAFSARELKVKSDRTGSGIILKNSRIVFNGTIPEKIFTISKPAAYDIVDLDKES